jgi:hypothetical protein
MPVTNRPVSNLPTGAPTGPGKLTTTRTSPDTATITYELGDRNGDREWNYDGLNVSAEAKLRMGERENLERIRVSAGVEGLNAKIDLVRDGELKPHFAGLSLRDGYFKGQVRDAGEYLKEHPLAATGAVVGVVAVAHVIAKETGDPIKVDTGKVRLYQNGGFSAHAVGEIAITGDKDILRAQGAKLRMGYTDADYGTMSLEAGYDRDDRTKVTAQWSKTTDAGVAMYANASYEQRSKNASVNVGLSYRW